MSIFGSVSLENKDFKLFQTYIYDKAGIRIQDHKRPLIENRLRKRLRELNLATYADYYAFLTSAQGEKTELSNFLDAITTNETYFFRHTPLWDYLMKEWLPKAAEAKRKVTIWSAACSTGEEPYSLAIAAQEAARQLAGTQLRIIATDISQQVIETAKQGLYKPYAIARMPKQYLTKYFTKSVAPRTGEDRYQLSPNIMRRVEFRLHNLKNPAPFTECDLILIRNVMIYFDGPIKTLVLKNLLRSLKKGGIICVGEAESLTNLVDGFIYVQPSIFRQLLPDELKDGIPRGRLTSARASAA